MIRMPYGKYRGQELDTIPPAYLLWLLAQGMKPGDVRDWIERNLLSLRQQVKADEQYRDYCKGKQ